MRDGEKQALIESPHFPISTVNDASAKEKGPGRPPHWEMVFWWTRKPLAGARAVILGSLLSGDPGKYDLIGWLKLTADKTPHRLNPELREDVKEKLKEVKLLDPFAGFGSIPLEAVRLGVGEVVAVEFLPAAYIFLKAILEYPKKYGSMLVADVEKWGKWITEQLKQDPDVKELYDEDVAVFIGTWEVRCPVCHRYTPLVGNWWLARVKNKKYAYMKPRAEEDKVSIEIVEGKATGAPSPNIRGKPEQAECLLCGSRITYIDPKTNRVYRSKSEANNKLIKLEFYPKHALKDWNRKLEEYLEGGLSMEELKSALARPRLLAKVKIVGKDLRFEPCTEEDNEKLWKALEKLKQIWRDPDIPTEPIPSYESRSIWVYPYGFDKWFKLFNPRQLLTLVKLVKLIREAGKRVKQEVVEEELARGFMFDTNIFDRIFDSNLEIPEGQKYYITHIQRDEIINMPKDKEERKEQLLKLLNAVPKELIPTEGFVLDISKLDLAKLMSKEDAELFDKMLKELEELDRKAGKKRGPENQIKDILILLTCLKNNIMLVTEDKELRTLAQKYGARVLSLEEFLQFTKDFEYAEAVTTYLVITLCKYADYNSLMTWANTSNPWGIDVSHTLATRGIAMQWSWCDTHPLKDITGIIRTIASWIRILRSTIDSLSYLVSAVSGSPSKVRALHDDATVMSKLNSEKFDVIVTDPPYRDDVPYAELSDFYYVWLKRALSDDGLAPRFHTNALIYNTQWESFALSEISYNEGRLRYFGVKEAEDYYERLLGMAFRRMSELLKDDGLMITYFAHSSPEAWIELVEAGWRRAGLRVTRAWGIATEFVQRVTARGKTVLESSVLVVWRKRNKDDERVGEYVEVYKEALENAKKAKEEALKFHSTSSDLFLATMLGALSTFTSYDRVVHFGRELTSRDVVRESYAIATRVIARATEAVRSPEALFYLASKSVYRLYSQPEGRTMLPDEPAEPIVLSSQDVIVLSYGFLRETGEAGKEGYKLFDKADIIRGFEGVKGANVSKPKSFVLLEPLSPTLEGLKNVLGRRRVNPIKLEPDERQMNSVDVLHLLEYYAKQGRAEFNAAYQSLYSKYPAQVREAVEVAKVISEYDGDPESDLSKLVKDYVEGR